MANKKKRAPIEQLRRAGRFAKELLIKRGIESKNSVLAEIMNTPGAPMLPGKDSYYLPHKWTLQASRRMMYDFLLIWIDKHRSGPSSQAENVTEFFKFLIGEMRKQEEAINQEIVNMPGFIHKMMKMKGTAVIKDVFSPLQKKDTVKAMHRFFVDSLAVALVVNKKVTTSEYLNWFLEWTEQLELLWIKPEKRKEITKT